MGKVECNEIVDKFIEKLEQIGRYNIHKKKYRIYIIDGKTINIRCTTLKKLWYSVDLNVLPVVDYIIYLTSSPFYNPDYFLMFPSKFLNEIVDEMYESEHANQNLKHFEIDWADSCSLILKNRGVDVIKYAYDLDNPKYYPNFN